MRRRKEWLAVILVLIPTVFGNVYDAAPIGWQQPNTQSQPGRLPPRSPMTRGYQAPPPPLIFNAPRSYQASYYQGPAAPQRTPYTNSMRPQSHQFNYAPSQQLHVNPTVNKGPIRPPPPQGPPRYDTGYNAREHKERQQEAEWMLQMLTYQDKNRPETTSTSTQGYQAQPKQYGTSTPGYPQRPETVDNVYGAPENRLMEIQKSINQPPKQAETESSYGTAPESIAPEPRMHSKVTTQLNMHPAQPALMHSGYVSAPNQEITSSEEKNRITGQGTKANQPLPPKGIPAQEEVPPAMPVPAPNAPHRLIFTPKPVRARPSGGLPPAFFPSNFNQPAHSPSYQHLRVVPETQHRQVVPSGGFRAGAGRHNSLENKNPPDVVNDIIVHIYLNAKERVSHSATKIGPIHGLFGIGTSHGGPGTHTNPIVITKDFDRERLKFVDRNMADEMMEEGPANIVEVKAMVSTPDSSPDRRIKETLNRAVDKELNRAIPVVLNRFHGSMTAIDNDLRKELEQALVDEIAKNLGETIDDMSNVSEEDLGKLIEEGFNEATAPPGTIMTVAVTSGTTRGVMVQTTRKPITEQTTRRTETVPTETSTMSTQARSRATEATRPVTETTVTTSSPEPSRRPSTIERTRPTEATRRVTEPRTRPTETTRTATEASVTSPPMEPSTRPPTPTTTERTRTTETTRKVTEARTRPTVTTTKKTTVTTSPLKEPTTEATTTEKPTTRKATIRTRPTQRPVENTSKVTTETTTELTTVETTRVTTAASKKTEIPWWMTPRTEAPRPQTTRTVPVISTTQETTTTPRNEKEPMPKVEEPGVTVTIQQPVKTIVTTETETEKPQVMITTGPKQNRPPMSKEENGNAPAHSYTPPPPLPRREEFGSEAEEPKITKIQVPPATTRVTRPQPTWKPVRPETKAPKWGDDTTESVPETTRSITVERVTTTEPSSTSSRKPVTTTEKERKLPFDFNQEGIPETHTIDENESKSMEISPSAVTTARPSNFAGENMGEGIKSSEERVTVAIPSEEEQEKIQTLTPPSATSDETSFEEGALGPIVTTKPIHIVHLDSNELDEDTTTSTSARTEPATTRPTTTTVATTKSVSSTGAPGTSMIFSSREETGRNPLKEKEEHKETVTSVQSTTASTHTAIFDESAFEVTTNPIMTDSTTTTKMVTFTPPIAIHSNEEEADSSTAPAAQESGRSLTKAPPTSFGEMNMNRAPATEAEKHPGRETLEEVSSSAENEAPESLNTPQGSCPSVNDPSDTNRSDIVFLLDSSIAFTEDKFMHSITLILHTVDQFKNIGPSGVQVSLVQYSNEPYLEFSLRKHHCKQWLKDDIANTEYMNGSPMLGKALDKVSRFAFTKRRGDRPDVENILVILTDGQSDDRIQQPVQFIGPTTISSVGRGLYLRVARENNVTVMVIATLEADPAYLVDLTGDMDNVFHVDASSPNQPLANKLAQRIRTIASPPQKEVSASTDEESPIHIHNHPPSVIDQNELEKPEKEENEVKEKKKEEQQVNMKCTFKAFEIEVNVAGDFYGVLSVKGREQDEECSQQIRPHSTAKTQSISIELPFDSCGVARVKSDTPSGLNNTIILQLQHNVSLRTAEDKAFLLQCYIPLKTEAEIQTNIEVINSEIIIAELISLSSVPPKCNYSIRVENENGPVIQRVTVGQLIYHKWECEDNADSGNVYGMKIHDCFASNDVEQKYPIIGKAGCSSDLAVLSDPVYSEDHLTAYAVSHAFGFQHTESLKFVCKLSLCTRDGDGCEGVTPPQCSSNSSGILLARRVPGSASSIDSALTSALSTQIAMKDKGLSDLHAGVASVAQSNITWMIAGAVLLVIVLAVLATVHRRDNWDSSTTSSASDVEMSGSSTRIGSLLDINAARSTVTAVSGPSNDPRPALSRDFLATFDRSKYV